MDEFWQDLVSGDIQFRDKWQFELKSEFFPRSTTKVSIYTQEFYIFIPNSLQINDQTYSKEQFYRDQTNLIRYKTPQFSLKELMDKKKIGSPLNRLRAMIEDPQEDEVEDELKLLGNILRSSLRNETLHLLIPSQFNDIEIKNFCDEIKHFRKEFFSIREKFKAKVNNENINTFFRYTDEFISNSIDYFLTGFLQEARERSLSDISDMNICELIIEEKKYREKIAPATEEKEAFLYRYGLLKKFIVDALLLNTSRSSLQQKYGHYIGSISAGIAMLIYVLLFVWQGHVFVVNSEPFIILTVFAYILKDRLKESLKNISYQRALRWFSDYAIEIRSPDDKKILGVLRESFAFINEDSVSPDVLKVRNKEFHTILTTVKRAEQVIYIKKIVKMFPDEDSHLKRRKALNIIFRFNIQDFLTKASDPVHSYTTLDPETKELIHTSLPKIYHLNVILRNTYLDENMKTKIELKKFRIIIDKDGIKHIEQIRQHA